MVSQTWQHIKKYYLDWQQSRYLNLFAFPKIGKVLDISCGSGSDLKFFSTARPTLEVYGVDMREEAIKKAETVCPQGKFFVADAVSLPFKDAYFDSVICIMSFHHYTQPNKVLKEVHRVLRPGGSLSLLDIIPRIRVWQWLLNCDGCVESYHFEKYYRVKEVLSMAERNNLQLEKIVRKDLLSCVKVGVFRKVDKTIKGL